MWQTFSADNMLCRNLSHLLIRLLSIIISLIINRASFFRTLTTFPLSLIFRFSKYFSYYFAHNSIYLGCFFHKRIMLFIFNIDSFVTGGHAVYWYYTNDREPSFIERVQDLQYHWGSVAAASLLTGFFYFIELIFDFFCVIYKLFSQVINLINVRKINMDNITPSVRISR